MNSGVVPGSGHKLILKGHDLQVFAGSLHLTCEQEGVGVSPHHHVHPADPPGDVLVHQEARVTQSDDLVHTYRLQFVHLQLQRRDLVLKLQMWT